MKKYIYLFVLSFSLIALTGCEDNNGPAIQSIDYVSFETPSSSFGVDIGGSNTNEFNFYASKTTNADRTFTLTVNQDLTTADPAAYNVPASVTIPGGSNKGTFSVAVSDVNIGADGKTLVIEFSGENGVATSDGMVLNISQICPLNDVKFSMVLDSYPEEVYWRLRDSSGNYIGSSNPAGPGYGGYAGMSGSVALDFCLPNGTYTFEVLDSYGDGGGAISITLADGTVLYSSDGAYGTGDTGTFTL